MSYGIFIRIFREILIIKVTSIFGEPKELGYRDGYVYVKIYYAKTDPSNKKFFEHFAKYVKKPFYNLIFYVDSQEKFHLIWQFLLDELKKIYYTLEDDIEYKKFFEDFFYICFLGVYFSNLDKSCYEKGLDLLYPILNESSYKILKDAASYINRCVAIKKDNKIYIGFHEGRTRTIYIDLDNLEIVPQLKKPLYEKIKICRNLHDIKTYKLSHKELLEIIEVFKILEK